MMHGLRHVENAVCISCVVNMVVCVLLMQMVEEKEQQLRE